jgi:hypothetical protein
MLEDQQKMFVIVALRWQVTVVTIPREEGGGDAGDVVFVCSSHCCFPFE